MLPIYILDDRDFLLRTSVKMLVKIDINDIAVTHSQTNINLFRYPSVKEDIARTSKNNGVSRDLRKTRLLQGSVAEDSVRGGE